MKGLQIAVLFFRHDLWYTWEDKSKERRQSMYDGGNDLPMVRDAAVGVAMGNACDELKAVADYITSSVDEDGVSRALEHFGLI